MKKPVTLLVIAVLLALILAGCAKERVNSTSDARGWHLNFSNFTGVKETMYPVRKGMNVSIRSNLSSGKIAVVLVLNGKNVFGKVLKRNETVNYTIPRSGDCLVKVFADRASGRFDFLI